MSAIPAASAPWYCAVLRHASAALARLAHRLEAPRGGLDPEASAPHQLLRARESAEEELREIRLRSLRYY